MKTTVTIWNISPTKLSESELSPLNKGLNFCPLTKGPNKEQLQDDLHFFWWKLKLKEYFYGGDSITDKNRKKKDVISKPNFQIATSKQTMKHL